MPAVVTDALKRQIASDFFDQFTSDQKKYYIGVSILNVYEVEAKNKEQAEEIVRNYSNEELLDDSDFNVNYIDEIKE